MKKLVRYIILVITLSVQAHGVWAQQNQAVSKSFKVLGNCEMCKQRIEEAAYDKLHVTHANWDAKTNQLTVAYDSSRTTATEIQKRVAEAGHDNDQFKAADGVYQSLPACCLYARVKGISAQQPLHTVSGIILEETVKGKIQPVDGATVRSLHTSTAFITDSTGVFLIQSTLPIPVIISYAGFKPDTITVRSSDFITVTLKQAASADLRTITISARRAPAYINARNTYNTITLGSAELSKAACCNLSESFETNPAVDVSYADAITGIKQIQLLGLSGGYTQLLTENVPEIKGLPGNYGLTFIPGPWIENIQITKGAGSVVNGYESIAGQINVEEKKPDASDRLLVNTYVNSMGRLEGNVNLSHRINSKWSTGLLSHFNTISNRHDGNHDGFLDIPVGRQYNFINRWKYSDNNGWIGQLSLKVLNDKRDAGQHSKHDGTGGGNNSHYAVDLNVEQYAVTGKLGYVFPNHKYKSLGLIVSANIYRNRSLYGANSYEGDQSNFNSTLIYQSIIGTTTHKYRTGLSFLNENYKERYLSDHSEHVGEPGHNHGGPSDSAVLLAFNRREVVPGAFFEYTYSATEQLSVIAGIRADYHNYFGWVTTPRLHVKYDLTPHTTIKASAGSGFRVANILSENAAALASSRKFEVLRAGNEYGYGLDPEKAWTFGLNIIQSFERQKRKAVLSLDAYRTQFLNQTVADYDAHPQQLYFYNLNGRSYANNVQVEFNYELIDDLDVRLAYKWLDAKTYYDEGLLQKPLISKHRAFLNLAYKVSDQWDFDVTVQWFGKKRIPYTTSNPSQLRLAPYSPDYFQVATQVTRKFGKKWELYTGVENLTGFRQKNPIVDAQNPFSKYFDASLVWGPIFGRMFYAGARFIL